MTLALGLFTLLDEHSSTGTWVGFQLLFGFGCGFVFTSCLPPILASLPDADVAAATGAWTFVRSFGSIWGTAIPAAVFNTRANKLAAGIADTSARALLVNGGAYEHATSSFLANFGSEPTIRDIIVQLYVESLHVVWQVSIAFSGFAFVLAFLVPSLKLREELVTEFGLEDSEAPEQVLDRGSEHSLTGEGKESL